MAQRLLSLHSALALALLTLSFNCISIVAQDNSDAWTSRISYHDTEIGTDSTGYYTRVMVELNTTMLDDSSAVKMIVGTLPGAGDIYSNTVLYYDAAFTGANTVHTQAGAIAIFTLGEYIIPDEDFFVDVVVD